MRTGMLQLRPVNTNAKDQSWRCTPYGTLGQLAHRRASLLSSCICTSAKYARNTKHVVNIIPTKAHTTCCNGGKHTQVQPTPVTVQHCPRCSRCPLCPNSLIWPLPTNVLSRIHRCMPTCAHDIPNSVAFTCSLTQPRPIYGCAVILELPFPVACFNPVWSPSCSQNQTT